MGNSCRLYHAIALTALVLVASPAQSKPLPTPPEPEQKPDWQEEAKQVTWSLTSNLFDPSSAEIRWTSGFQWGYRKPLIGKREFGWVACLTLNAKNRMGGYAGARSYIAFISPPSGAVVSEAADFFSVCDTGPFVDAQQGLRDISPNQPPQGEASNIADEIRKLAGLRDEGIITAAEFDRHKAKLLSQ